MQISTSLPLQAISIDRYPGFKSFKTVAPIQYPRRWMRDALVRSTFDDRVLALAPASTPFNDLPAPFEFSFREHLEDGMRIVLLTQADKSSYRYIEDSKVSVVTRNELISDRMALAAGVIWSHKRAPVDAGDRYRAIEFAVNRQPNPVRMSEIVSLMRNGTLDPVHQVLSFLANGHLTAKLDAGLGFATSIFPGPIA